MSNLETVESKGLFLRIRKRAKEWKEFEEVSMPSGFCHVNPPQRHRLVLHEAILSSEGSVNLFTDGTKLNSLRNRKDNEDTPLIAAFPTHTMYLEARDAQSLRMARTNDKTGLYALQTQTFEKVPPSEAIEGQTFAPLLLEQYQALRWNVRASQSKTARITVKRFTIGVDATRTNAGVDDNSIDAQYQFYTTTDANGRYPYVLPELDLYGTRAEVGAKVKEFNKTNGLLTLWDIDDVGDPAPGLQTLFGNPLLNTDTFTQDDEFHFFVSAYDVSNLQEGNPLRNEDDKLLPGTRIAEVHAADTSATVDNDTGAIRMTQRTKEVLPLPAGTTVYAETSPFDDALELNPNEPIVQDVRDRWHVLRHDDASHFTLKGDDVKTVQFRACTAEEHSLKWLVDNYYIEPEADLNLEMWFTYEKFTPQQQQPPKFESTFTGYYKTAITDQHGV